MIVRRVIGAVLIVMGGVWFFQGIGVIGGSFMTREPLWSLIGAVTAIVGVALVGWRRRSKG